MDVLKHLRREDPKLAVLMLSTQREDQYAARALKPGASGYLNTQSAPAELVNAIRLVTTERKYVTLALDEELANHMSTDSEIPPHDTLSDREYQTLVMIASGKSVGDIAKGISLSVKTISMYRTRLVQKMKM